MHDESLYAERALRAGAMGYVNNQAPARSIIDANSWVTHPGRCPYRLPALDGVGFFLRRGRKTMTPVNLPP